MSERNYLTDDTRITSWLFTTDHKRVGILYMSAILSFFTIAVILGVLTGGTSPSLLVNHESGDPLRVDQMILNVYDDDGTGPLRPYLYAGGSFTTAGGSVCNRLARWADGTWAPTTATLDGDVLIASITAKRSVTLAEAIAFEIVQTAQQETSMPTIARYTNRVSDFRRILAAAIFSASRIAPSVK